MFFVALSIALINVKFNSMALNFWEIVHSGKNVLYLIKIAGCRVFLSLSDKTPASASGS